MLRSRVPKCEGRGTLRRALCGLNCYNQKGRKLPILNAFQGKTKDSMTLRLFNTLSGKLDELVPADGKALRMYACGPTVYDYGHIGNFRTFLQIDVLRRFLLLTGVPVRHVMNITDVDDKIIRNAAAAGISIRRVHGTLREGVS